MKELKELLITEGSEEEIVHIITAPKPRLKNEEIELAFPSKRTSPLESKQTLHGDFHNKLPGFPSPTSSQ